MYFLLLIEVQLRCGKDNMVDAFNLWSLSFVVPRWEEVITHVPCGGTDTMPAGALLLVVNQRSIDGVGGALGYAGPDYVWNDCPGVALLSTMVFDIDDLMLLTEFELEILYLHEMGHAIGFGSVLRKPDVPYRELGRTDIIRFPLHCCGQQVVHKRIRVFDSLVRSPRRIVVLRWGHRVQTFSASLAPLLSGQYVLTVRPHLSVRTTFP